MSFTYELSKGYGSFFLGCTQFAVSPYTKTFMAIAQPNQCNNGDELIANALAATVIVGILTFSIPVLPAIASVTFALSSIAMLTAVASMFVTYPAAILADIVSGPDIDWSAGYHMSQAYGPL